jgi:hypothetical protein
MGDERHLRELDCVMPVVNKRFPAKASGSDGQKSFDRRCPEFFTSWMWVCGMPAVPKLEYNAGRYRKGWPSKALQISDTLYLTKDFLTRILERADAMACDRRCSVLPKRVDQVLRLGPPPDYR